VNLHFTGGPLPHGAQCTFGVDNNGASATAVATAVSAAITSSSLLANLSDSVTISTIHVKLGPNATGAFVDLANAQTGGDNGATISPNVTLLVKKTTTLGGREGSGRMYWPGLGEGQVDEAGNIDGSTLSALQTKFSDFSSDMTTAGYPLFLLHNSATAPTGITGLQVQSVAATQRRRLRP
jgi:hypothetical protein